MKKSFSYTKTELKMVEFSYEEIERILLDYLGFEYWNGFKVKSIDCDIPIDFIKLTLEHTNTGGSVG